MTLDLLPFLLSDYPAFCNGLLRREKEEKPVVKLWTKVLKVKGYDPEDIKVTVENGKAIIHCRHEEKDGENFDLIESRRSVPLPQNVDLASVKTFMIDEDSLLIQAQFKKLPEETTKKVQAAKETKTVSEDGTVRTLPIVIEQSRCENKEQESQKEESCILTAEKPVACRYNGDKEVVETHADENREIELKREEGGNVSTPSMVDNREEESTCNCDSLNFSLKDYNLDTAWFRYMESCDKGCTLYQEVFRRYTVPKGCAIGFTKACMNDSEILKISVPINPK
ncbi:hypothetical protein ACJMK2_035123 [Sinanodonta woodiana]|uniref:SHSP domain-containing protein n=1 Tax=Sinanodonta woodiana TaxID=1069815 RepID=A0ABD3WXD4_SINWO